MQNYNRKLIFVTVLLIASLVLAACGAADSPAPAASGDSPAASQVSIRYVLWDANQLPAYEQCAADFMAANPNIQINITQTGWDDYWNGIQTGMVAGTAPDVFTNHLAKYPEFALNNQLVDIQPFVERDGVDTSIYIGELADLWGRDGARFGLPKDWDTVAVVYNAEMLEAAGVTVEELNSATWNPQDGGTYENILARLTLDNNGNNALSPDFNRNNVVQYGLAIGGANPYGQTEWSHYAVSNGFRFIDELYATEYHYDDPALIETIDWLTGLALNKGIMTPFELVSGLGANAMFTARQAAITTDGSWMIGFYADNADFEVGFARLPIGPEGRKSMFNGLADSIWTGTRHVEESWQWVKYLASPACQNVVGEFGVVFPAIESGVANALAAFEAKGLDVSPFTEQALEENGTFLFPVTDSAAEITSLMTEVMQGIWLGQTSAADALPAANQRVNSILQQ